MSENITESQTGIAQSEHEHTYMISLTDDSYLDFIETFENLEREKNTSESDIDLYVTTIRNIRGCERTLIQNGKFHLLEARILGMSPEERNTFTPTKYLEDVLCAILKQEGLFDARVYWIEQLEVTEFVNRKKRDDLFKEEQAKEEMELESNEQATVSASDQVEMDN